MKMPTPTRPKKSAKPVLTEAKIRSFIKDKPTRVSTAKKPNRLSP